MGLWGGSSGEVPLWCRNRSTKSEAGARVIDRNLAHRSPIWTNSDAICTIWCGGADDKVSSRPGQVGLDEADSERPDRSVVRPILAPELCPRSSSQLAPWTRLAVASNLETVGDDQHSQCEPWVARKGTRTLLRHAAITAGPGSSTMGLVGKTLDPWGLLARGGRRKLVLPALRAETDRAMALQSLPTPEHARLGTNHDQVGVLKTCKVARPPPRAHVAATLSSRCALWSHIVLFAFRPSPEASRSPMARSCGAGLPKTFDRCWPALADVLTQLGRRLPPMSAKTWA